MIKNLNFKVSPLPLFEGIGGLSGRTKAIDILNSCLSSENTVLREVSLSKRGQKSRNYDGWSTLSDIIKESSRVTKENLENQNEFILEETGRDVLRSTTSKTYFYYYFYNEFEGYTRILQSEKRRDCGYSKNLYSFLWTRRNEKENGYRMRIFSTYGWWPDDRTRNRIYNITRGEEVEAKGAPRRIGAYQGSTPTCLSGITYGSGEFGTRYRRYDPDILGVQCILWSNIGTTIH